MDESQARSRFLSLTDAIFQNFHFIVITLSKEDDPQVIFATLNTGGEPDRLKPILAGVLDLKPWLIQWHNALDTETGERLGQYFAQFAESQCQELGFSPEEVHAWRPNSTASRGGEPAGERNEHDTE